MTVSDEHRSPDSIGALIEGRLSAPTRVLGHSAIRGRCEGETAVVLSTS